MNNEFRDNLINRLKTRYGNVKKSGNGHTLFYIPSADFYVYFRYSKLFGTGKSIQKTFYGLRKEDLDIMQGKKSYICFLTDDDERNITLPFLQYENYFFNTSSSSDGQFKVAMFFKQTGAELSINNVGKFSTESYLGTEKLLNIEVNNTVIPDLTHSQIQSLIGSIGIKKGFDIWFPKNDKTKIDSSIVNMARIRENLPNYNREIDHIISEIDVIWLDNTSPVSFYEVEHSTPIYSGLLRFNDVLLTVPNVENFNIIANNDRENKFGREINRPTFKQNKLIEKVAFLDYENIYNWHVNLFGKLYSPSAI